MTVSRLRLYLACISLLPLTGSFSSAFGQTTPSYSMVRVGDLGGPVTGVGLNNEGLVVGSAYLPNGTYHAYIWSLSSGMIDLGTLPGDASSNATSINNLGWVTGTSQQADGNFPKGFLWRPDVGMVTIASTGPLCAQPSAVTDTGLIVGRASPDGFQQTSFGFTYNMASGLAQVTAGGNPTYEVLTANSGGSMVVTNAQSVNSIFVAPGHDPVEIAGTILTNTVALGINNSGTVVGSADNGASPYAHAFQWSATGGMLDLTPDLPLHGRAYATAINNLDEAVGYEISSDGSFAGILWADGKSYDLSTLINPESLLGWSNLTAYGINDVGQIVGTGTFNGQTEAFLLTPTGDSSSATAIPEPATLSLLALASLALTGRRRTL